MRFPPRTLLERTECSYRPGGTRLPERLLSKGPSRLNQKLFNDFKIQPLGCRLPILRRTRVRDGNLQRVFTGRELATKSHSRYSKNARRIDAPYDVNQVFLIENRFTIVEQLEPLLQLWLRVRFINSTVEHHVAVIEKHALLKSALARRRGGVCGLRCAVSSFDKNVISPS